MSWSAWQACASVTQPASQSAVALTPAHGVAPLSSCSFAKLCSPNMRDARPLDCIVCIEWTNSWLSGDSQNSDRVALQSCQDPASIACFRGHQNVYLPSNLLLTAVHGYVGPL